MKRRQLCGWHWLMKQPAAVQTNAARGRWLACPRERRLPRVPKAQWPAGMRWCGVCCSMVPLFYARGSRCRACSSAASHAAAVQKTYGITIREYNQILKAQGGRCAICGCLPRTRRFAVDHDHKKSGREAVRGILCQKCNHELLGAAHDDVKILRRAIAYLEHPTATLQAVRNQSAG